jgi:5'(3')-deoxyribonucleotidase
MKGLKEKYANLKRTTKQKFSKNRQQILKTGGGSCETINFTDIDTTLKDILGEQVDGLNNIYDSDCVQSKKLNFTRFLCVLIFLKLFLIFIIDEVNEGNSAEVRAEVISDYDEIAASTTEPISCEGRYEMLNDKNYKNY